MELAQRYPGSLRELDALPMETLDERIARLEQLIANVANADGSSEALPWVVPMARFHGLLQGALAVKASLFPGGRRGALFDEGPLRQRLKDIPDALPFLQDLARVAAPPGGRLLPLVLEKLVAETGLDEPRLRELLHPLLSLPLRPPSHPTNS
jgi:hypothetical protein